jgi:hypothetical protein
MSIYKIEIAQELHSCATYHGDFSGVGCNYERKAIIEQL